MAASAQQHSPEAVIEWLDERSAEVRAVALFDGEGQLLATTGVAADRADAFAALAGELIGAADSAGARAGIAEPRRVEVSRQGGGLYALRAGTEGGRSLTLVALAAGSPLASLLFYDMRMALRAAGAHE